MKKLSIIFTLIAFPFFGQMTEAEIKTMISNTEGDQLVVECSRFLQENFFHFADLVTDKLLKSDPKNGNFNYRKGFIILGMNGSPEVALKHLEIASAKTEINYDIYSPKETSAPIDVFYYLGICHHRMGNLDKALGYYNVFMEKTQKNSTLIPSCEIRIAQLAVAKKSIAGGVGSTAALLGSDVNTTYNDLAPMISPDGKSLLYSSSRPRTDKSSAAYVEPMFNVLPADIYQISKDKSGNWSASWTYGMNDAKGDEIISGLSLNERHVNYSSWNDPILYQSDFSAGVFAKPTPVAVSVNNLKEKTAPFNMQLTYSSDGKYAYFVSNALSGKGGWDIFQLEKTGEVWSAAKNMAMLNTEADEMAPFITIDGKTMYFVSNSKESMGGFDVFKSTCDANGMWSKPTNLGMTVNSNSDEIGFSLTADGTLGYVASNRIGTTGMYDIFSADISETPSGVALLNGRIVNTKGKEIPEQSYITLKCLNCSNTMENVLSPRMRDGVFLSSLEKCKEYELAYYYGPLTKKPYTNRFKTSCDNSFEQITKYVLILDADEKIVPFPTYEIKGVVTDVATGNLIADAKISLSIDANSDLVQTQSNGMYQSDIISSYLFESHASGSVKADAEGYLSASAKVNTDLLEDSIVTVNFKLEATEKGFLGPYFVNYQFDRYNLTDFSKNKLKEVIQVMNDNPTLKIEIRSHTDSRGPAIYNQKLSEMRAKTAMNYLKGFVVNPDRISCKGFGESELLKPCGDGVTCSDEDHLQNRRTEFIILK